MASRRDVCALCGNIISVEYSVPEQIWSMAVPKNLSEEKLCICCFTRLADEGLIAWDKDIEFYPSSRASKFLDVGMGEM